MVWRKKNGNEWRKIREATSLNEHLMLPNLWLFFLAILPHNNSRGPLTHFVFFLPYIHISMTCFLPYRVMMFWRKKNVDFTRLFDHDSNQKKKIWAVFFCYLMCAYIYVMIVKVVGGKKERKEQRIEAAFYMRERWEDSISSWAINAQAKKKMDKELVVHG